VEAHVASLDRRNVRELLFGCELVFDGLDCYATRFLLNDFSLARGTPYLYAGVVRGEMSAHAVVPGVTGCLRCLLDAPPAPGEAPICAAEGVFPPLLGLANLLQLDAAQRILASTFTATDDALYSFRMDDLQLRRTLLSGPSADCPACAGRYGYLDGVLGDSAAGVCAPDRVELVLSGAALSLERAEMLLRAAGGFELKRNPWCLIAQAAEGLRYTIFASGRLVLGGSGDPLALERFAATYLGV
jgi:adenylyltransferase/sulfurtransferase